MKRWMLILLAGACFFAGCSAKQAMEKTAVELADEGMLQFRQGKYTKSIASFQKLKDWYPFSKYAALAELKTADAHFAMGDYEEAAVEYVTFEQLHPRNEAVAYVVYRIGLCHYHRMETVDRDQSSTKQALDAFTRLVRQYPESPYTNKALPLIKSCRRNLAEHEFIVGMFYYKMERYRPALHRFESVVTEYADTGVHKKALRYIARCRKALEQK